MERKRIKKVAQTIGAALVGGLVNTTDVGAQTPPPRTVDVDERPRTQEEVKAVAEKSGFSEMLRELTTASRNLSAVVAYLNSFSTFSEEQADDVVFRVFPALLKNPELIPRSEPFIHLCIRSSGKQDYTFTSLGQIMGNVYRKNVQVYRRLARTLLDQPLSPEHVSRALFTIHQPFPLTFIELDSETQHLLHPALTNRFGHVGVEEVLANYAKDYGEMRDHMSFGNLLDLHIQKRVLERILSDASIPDDARERLASDAIRLGHRWALDASQKELLTRIAKLEPYAVFSNATTLKSIPNFDTLGVLETSALSEDYQESVLTHFDLFSDISGADEMILRVLEARKTHVDLAYVAAFLEKYSESKQELSRRIQLMFPDLTTRFPFETALTAQNQRTDFERMRTDPALEFASRISYESVLPLVEDTTFNVREWSTRIQRYDSSGRLYQIRSRLMLQALKDLHDHFKVNPIELAHARLIVARNLISNNIPFSAENVKNMIQEIQSTREKRDSMSMQGHTLLLTHDELIDHASYVNPKGTPHFGTDAQIKELAHRRPFEHIKGNDTNAHDVLLQKLVTAPPDLRFVFLGHGGGGKSGEDYALYLNDGAALSGGRAVETADTKKITTVEFATALVKRYRRGDVDPSSEIFYFSGCQLKNFVDVVRSTLITNGIVPPTMTAAAEHGQSNFISHDGVYGPRIDEEYVRSITLGDFRRATHSVRFRSKPPIFSPSVVPQPQGVLRRYLQIGSIDVDTASAHS